MRRGTTSAACVHTLYGWDCGHCHDDPPAQRCPVCGRTEIHERYPWAHARTERERDALLRDAREAASVIVVLGA